MSISKHIYYADSEYPRTIVLNHGGSGTQVLSDSDDRIKENFKKYKRVWKTRGRGNWRIIVKGIPEKKR
jgi:hypothetical protein